MDIQTIDPIQFQMIEPIRRVINHDYPRKFAYGETIDLTYVSVFHIVKPNHVIH